MSISSEFSKPEGPETVVPFWIASFYHYGGVISQVLNVPSVCLLGNSASDFQDHQCDHFWGELLKSGGLAAAPFFVLAILMLLGLDELSSTYKRIQNRVEKGAGALGGIVTDPPEGTPDIFSWFYCFRPVMVELSTHEQIKVYVSGEVQLPAPGVKLIIFDMGQRMGEKRRVARIYAPHVAVLRGE